MLCASCCVHTSLTALLSSFSWFSLVSVKLFFLNFSLFIFTSKNRTKKQSLLFATTNYISNFVQQLLKHEENVLIPRIWPTSRSDIGLRTLEETTLLLLELHRGYACIFRAFLQKHLILALDTQNENGIYCKTLFIIMPFQ